VPGAERERDIAAESAYLALFRVLSIDELSGSEKALEWARAMVDDADLRRAFSEGVLKALAEREARGS
jgi:hypothetical protein